ncbi:MAG: pyridoxal phosphate-dependent aminotransferase [Bacteroidales bacterium]|nr:pyridoxal phosphate-dependent aminotransferase [Bacteroidales bacterium]
MRPIDKTTMDDVLLGMDINDLSHATIRQCVNAAKELERVSNEKFVHLEFGVPGLKASQIGIDMQKLALDAGIAAVYPPTSGIPEFKWNASAFINAFVGIAISPEGVIPTVGSMQGCFNLLMECSQLHEGRNAVVYISPGFPSHYLQSKVLGLEARVLDIYNYRGKKLQAALEDLLSDGKVCAILYSNPNNPTWACLTEEELKIIGGLCDKYDVIALEDMAYLCMDFRLDRSVPFSPPYQPTVGRYTDNFVLMISASKIFSYAGERIGFVAISNKLYEREYPSLKERYGLGKFGDNFVLTFIYVNSSGCSRSAQNAMSEMMEASVSGKYDFVGELREYARRARRAKEIFFRHGFTLVYDKDLDQDVSDGFFFTIGYEEMSGSALLYDLMRCGICAITLSATRSMQQGIRVCVSMLNSDKDFELLDERLGQFVKIQGEQMEQ